MEIENRLEFTKIKEIWMEYALTEHAKEEIRKIVPYLSENELSAKQRETTEAKMMIEKLGNPPLVSLSGIAEFVEIAQKGDCLSAVQLEEIEKALVAVMRLKKYLQGGKHYNISLAYDEEGLSELLEVREQISRQIRSGRVEDHATNLLWELRSEIERTECLMKEKAEAVMRANKECMSDSFCTYRNGRLCVPVKKEYKHRISGSVLDKSATGNTLFIEPTAVANYEEILQSCRIDAENEERRILYTLTVMVAEHEEQIRADIRIIEKLDFAFSKGKLSLFYQGTQPEIRTDRKLRLVNARHPLMDRKICVPLQLEMGDGIRGIVITGPNTGGKTVAIKTVALNCMMAQCGLHVACEEARICLNSNFLCDIGDGQNLSENLSTFSAHIVNVLEILKKVNRESLVIMDELGSGTDPTEGMGIAIAVLEELKKSGALFLVTTHYPEVKLYAQKTEGVLNARMAFDKESMRPLYQMIVGEAGESCALYIAAKLGMPDHMLARAMEEAYGGQAKENLSDLLMGNQLEKEHTGKVQKKKIVHRQEKAEKFKLGDSVMVYPDQKIGIVCRTANEKGVLQVQMPDKKIWINHKRLKLHVAADQLYPEDYDFSIIFDTVENRKLRHQMERKYVEGAQIELSEK